MQKSYFQKLKDPRWQKKRLEALDVFRDDLVAVVEVDRLGELEGQHARSDRHRRKRVDEALIPEPAHRHVDGDPRHPYARGDPAHDERL